jgi:hypothetical protein
MKMAELAQDRVQQQPNCELVIYITDSSGPNNVVYNEETVFEFLNKPQMLIL